MIRRVAVFLVCFCAYLVLLAESQRKDEMDNSLIEQMHLESVAQVAQ